MKKDIIIFIESYIYLSDPQYYTIAPKLNEFLKVYLYLDHPLTAKVHNTFLNKEKVLKYFDKYIELKYINFKSESWWKAYRKRKKDLTTILYKINPKAIISCADKGLENRIIIAWCKKRRIPFIILQPSFIYAKRMSAKKHGIVHQFKYIMMNKILGILKYSKNEIWGHRDQSTYLFLWSESFVINPKRKNMYFIGNPAFDNHFREFSTQKEIKNNIIICTQALDLFHKKETFQQINNIFLEAIKSKPDINFYIKIHPRTETIEKYEKIFDKDKFPNFKILQNESLYDLFKICVLQMSSLSYTSFEAVVMGLPIIIVNPNNKLKLFDHFRGEIEIKVTLSDEISKSIDLALSDDYWRDFIKKRRKFCEKWLYSTDGQSGQRAADLIKKIVYKRN